MKPTRPAQLGFAAMTAIFLVVVLAALGGFMLTFSNAQQLGAARDVQGSRAYWAAKAGLEWAAVAIPAAPALCPSATPTLVAGPTLIDGFSIQIRCSKIAYSEGSATKTIYIFESRALLGGAVGSVGYVERSLSASMEI